jgi:HD-GYP domain-containing protein (c-di-GMP phosphodiesterase class II)
VLRVSIQQAQKGMVLARSVPHPHRPETVLLRPGATLNDHAIDRLLELGVHEVWVRYPGLEHLVRFSDPRILAAQRGVVALASRAMDDTMARGRAPADYHSFRKAVMAMVDRLVENPSASILLGDVVSGSKPFLRHASRTCFLSILMGLRLDYYLLRERTRMVGHSAKDLSALGLGSLFHDVGLLKLDQDALAEWARQGRDEQDPLWRSHVQLGFDMVKEHAEPVAAGVVLHHHQHFDGSGFPARVDLAGNARTQQGSDIHVFARIVACAEMYDRLRGGAFLPCEQDVTPVPAVRALRAMLEEPLAHRFDPVVLGTLVEVAPPYPPGSFVTITGGRHAVVVEWSAADPCRPVVETIDLEDTLGTCRHSRPERIDLRQAVGVEIIEHEGVDVSGDNFPATFVASLGSLAA